MSAPAPTAPPRHSCRFHCSPCGRHFLSLKAFDFHRSGPYSGQRICLDPADLPERFRMLTEEGVCKLTGGAPAEHQVVWGLEGIDSERLAALKAGRPASGDSA